jgi:exodeoxyribonuclease VII small subunit
MSTSTTPGTAASGEPSSPTFEASMSRLESIVASLEGGRLALDDSLASFEEGLGLLRSANRSLDGAAARLQVLTELADGSFVLTPAASPTAATPSGGPAVP